MFTLASGGVDLSDIPSRNRRSTGDKNAVQRATLGLNLKVYAAHSEHEGRGLVSKPIRQIICASLTWHALHRQNSDVGEGSGNQYSQSTMRVDAFPRGHNRKIRF